MSILIFLLILSALVIVHELGHMSVAKFFGIKVDEFGLGYPPKAKTLDKWRGTEFTLNWLPFGGFVKIFGENPALNGEQNQDHHPDNFQSKNRGIQATVLFAGVFFNFIFAWMMIALGFVSGLPASAGFNLPTENEKTLITVVMPGLPADRGGLRSGDAIISLSRGQETLLAPDSNTTLTPADVSEYIGRSLKPITFQVERGGQVLTFVVTPQSGILPGKPAIGVSMESVGIVRLPPHQALYYSLKATWELTLSTAKALGVFIAQAFSGQADFSGITGPVGLVGMTGDVAELGFGYLLSFTAIISINLCLINLLPFPALDGGRLMFVGIEALVRKPIPAKILNAVNATGFAILVFLMILITIRDVRNIF